MKEPVITHLDLDDFRDNSRLLFVFAPRERDPRLASELEEFSGREDEMLDRDIVLLVLLEAGTSRMDADQVSAEVVEHMRHEFKVASGEFAMVLVGKDGAEKTRWHDIVTADELFSAIDAMPMRRKEIRERGRH